MENTKVLTSAKEKIKEIRSKIRLPKPQNSLPQTTKWCRDTAGELCKEADSMIKLLKSRISDGGEIYDDEIQNIKDDLRQAEWLIEVAGDPETWYDTIHVLNEWYKIEW